MSLARRCGGGGTVGVVRRRIFSERRGGGRGGGFGGDGAIHVGWRSFGSAASFPPTGRDGRDETTAPPPPARHPRWITPTMPLAAVGPAAHPFAGPPGTASASASPSVREMSSLADLLPSVPDFAQSWTIWGGSAKLLRFLHYDGAVPYWACMSLTNVVVRSSLLPLVVQGARTQARVAPVAPELQYLITMFQNDMKGMKERGASPVEKFHLVSTTRRTVSAIYKLNKISPLAPFYSPLLQLPIFYYFAIDIRKIINGLDPELAQGLTEGGLLWVTDLTEPDPWYGLPILGGALLYLNVEVAMGRKSLSGEVASKSKFAGYLKDFFQSLAVFMPCFMAHNPAGVQIYLATSFVFTLFQGAALRSDAVRSLFSLPSLSAPPPEAELFKEFAAIKALEKKAREEREARGTTEVLGKHGVLAEGWEASFAGNWRSSTIAGSSPEALVEAEAYAAAEAAVEAAMSGEAVRLAEMSISARPSLQAKWEPRKESGVMLSQTSEEATSGSKEQEEEGKISQALKYLEEAQEEDMIAANKGIIMVPKKERDLDAAAKEKLPAKLSVKRFVDKKQRGGKGKTSKKKPRSRRR